MESLLTSLLNRHVQETKFQFGKEYNSIASRDEIGEEQNFRSRVVVTSHYKNKKELEIEIQERKKVRTNDELMLNIQEIPQEVTTTTRALQVRKVQEPEDLPIIEHAQWKLYRVVTGHRGVPKAIAVDPDNRVFATGGMDNVIKIHKLATGELLMEFENGHTHAIRSLAFSPRHAYLFSASEDKQIKAWDLELNQLVRHYHGHTAGVYCLGIHPTLDVLCSGSRDGTVKIWDMRTRQQVHTMIGHKDAVMCLGVQNVEPQLISGSEDCTVRLWDISSGKSIQTLTHHKKGVRALSIHPNEYSFASASTGSIKKFSFPNGQFMQNFQFDENEPKVVIHTLLNHRNGDLTCAGTDDGYIKFWDWKSTKLVQKLKMKTLPGTLESEAGVQALSFDATGSRLIACVGDKSIQMFKPIEVN